MKSPLLSLVLDTSTERGIVALLRDGSLAFSKELPFGLQNSQFLLPELQRGLHQTGIRISELAFIGVGIGPGSYTGIRVGATVAKSLSFANRIPVVGVCTLETFVPEVDGRYAVVIDAKIGGIYMQKGEMDRGVAKNVAAPGVYPLEEAARRLRETSLIVTPNIGQLQAKLATINPKAQWKWEECYPSPLVLERLAREKFDKNDYNHEGQLELLYMRKTQAEIEREK